MLPPELFSPKLKMNPVPEPPLAIKVSEPRGGAEVPLASRLTADPMVIELVALLPSESTTDTTSVTSPVAPAT